MDNPYGSGFITDEPSGGGGKSRSNSIADLPKPTADPTNYGYGFASGSIPSGAGYPRISPTVENSQPLPESPMETPSFNFHPLNMNTDQNFYSLHGSPVPVGDLSIPSLSSHRLNKEMSSGSGMTSGSRYGSANRDPRSGQGSPKGGSGVVTGEGERPSLSVSPLTGSSAVNVGSGSLEEVDTSPKKALPGFSPIGVHQSDDSNVLSTERTTIYETPHSIEEASQTRRFTGSPATGAPLSSVNSNIVMGSVFPSTPQRKLPSAPGEENAPTPNDMPRVPAPPKSFTTKLTSPASSNALATPVQSKLPSVQSSAAPSPSMPLAPNVSLNSKSAASLSKVSSHHSAAAAVPSAPHPLSVSNSSTSLTHVTTPSVSITPLSTSGAPSAMLSVGKTEAVSPLLLDKNGSPSFSRKDSDVVVFSNTPLLPLETPLAILAEDDQTDTEAVEEVSIVEEAESVPVSAPPVSPATASSAAPPTPVVPVYDTTESRPSIGLESNVSQPFSPYSEASSKEKPPKEPPVTPNHFTGQYMPLVAQHNYHKSDIKLLSVASEYTFGDLQSCDYVIEAVTSSLLLKLEPKEVIKAKYEKMSKVKSIDAKLKRQQQRQALSTRERRRSTSVTTQELPMEAKVARHAIEPLTPYDVSNGLIAYDNLMMAISFALFKTVTYTNALVELADQYFREIRESNFRKERAKRKEGRKEEDWDAHLSSSSGSYTDLKTFRVKVSVPTLFRWVNSLGIDVLVVSEDRRAASSFCAKKNTLVRNGLNSEVVVKKGPITELSSLGSDSQPFTHESSVEDDTPKRILVVLEYDSKRQLWSPLTIKEPIRETAAYVREENRLRRKEKHKLFLETLREEEKAKQKREEQQALEAKRIAWINKNVQAEEQWRVSHTATLAAPDPLLDPRIVKEGAPAEDKTTAGNQLPFSTFVYPNLTQTDCGCIPVLKQSMHPIFGCIRIKLFLGLLLSVCGLAIGIASLVFTSVHVATCVFSTATGQCIPSADSSSCQTRLFSGLEKLGGNIAKSVLFGAPVAGGNALVVAISLQFVYLLCLLMVVFMATRFMATKSKKAVCFYVLQIVHVLMAAVMCAFSAYAVYYLKNIANAFQCASLSSRQQVYCDTLYEVCASSGLVFQVQYKTSKDSTTVFALTLVFTILCGLELLIALLPLLPKKAVQEQLRMAVPDTIAFLPNYYAPDGLHSAAQRELLHQQIRPTVKKDIRHQIKKKGRVLTHNASIGQMMQINREQSLQRMQLKQKKQVHHRRREGRRRGQFFNRTRYTVYKNDGNEWEDLLGEEEQKNTVLPPATIMKIENISSTLKDRERRRSSSVLLSTSKLEFNRSDTSLSSHKQQSDSVLNPFAFKTDFPRLTSTDRPVTSTDRSRSVSDRREEGAPGVTVTFNENGDEEMDSNKKLVKMASNLRVGRYGDSRKPSTAGDERGLRTKSSFINVLPSFHASTTARPIGGVSDGDSKPRADGPVTRLNPFVRNVNSDRLQRRNLMDLEPQIDKIASRLNKERSSVSSRDFDEK
ncbi:hypothetical protein ADEAN_000403200 [Angomonas deanei]|uniref:Uncharacterized protein n=1 Tax=Angomonas deanei TaxID=59799 RepID=A0A7G2C9P5_9TRYP|nr:hypothetical protein ADEAN_000403200 [Angomonas deanei]